MAIASSSNAASSSAGPSSKPSGYNVNASSMLGLLSEVSKHAEANKKGKTRDKNAIDEAGTSKGKKSSIFDRKNRGIEARSARDTTHMKSRSELSTEARRVLESRERLERKAELYERLARGESVNGVSRDQLKAGLLVDFETKALEAVYNDRSPESSDESDESDEDESKRVPKAPLEDDDELVETQDDLGRTRWVRRSALRQQQLDGVKDSEGRDRKSALEGGVPMYSNDIQLASQSMPTASTYYGDQHQFHVYQPTEEEIAERRKRLNLDAPLNAHFDSAQEIRNRGAGFMQFSADEETRKRQMEELKNERDTTEAERVKLAASGDIVAQRDREAQERRRLIEERRQKLLDKRKAADAKAQAEKR